MAVVFGAIAPHGWLAVPELCAPAELHLAAATQEAMLELGTRFDAAAPEATILFTPHNVHVEGCMAVLTAATLAGSLPSEDPAQSGIHLEARIDRPLALAIRDELRAEGLPVVGVSYGANDETGAEMPMDWATLIPLWYLGGRRDPAPPVVVVAPARELAAGDQVRAGLAVAAAAEKAGRRVAVIASADHGHGHLESGPYGFSPASKPFDERVVEIVRSGSLGELVAFERTFVDEARADSWWQLLMLHGALQGAGAWTAELLSYEAPTYFGMLCASFLPA